MLSFIINIQENLSTSLPLDLAYYYHQLGVVYFNKSEYNLALEYHFKCLKIRETKLGSEHVDTATSYSSIG